MPPSCWSLSFLHFSMIIINLFSCMILCMHEMHLYANMWSLYVLGRYEVVFPFVVCITQAGLAKFFSLQLGVKGKEKAQAFCQSGVCLIFCLKRGVNQHFVKEGSLGYRFYHILRLRVTGQWREVAPGGGADDECWGSFGVYLSLFFWSLLHIGSRGTQ